MTKQEPATNREYKSDMFTMIFTMKQKLSDSQKSANYPYQTFNRPF